MSSLIGHGLAGMSLWTLGRRAPALRPLESRAWLAGAAAAACLPDLDALLGLPHRGPTHTLGFALAIALLCALAAVSRGLKKEALAIGGVTVLIVWSHPALDLCTGGGPDVALFRPFWTREFQPRAGGLPLTGYTHHVGGLLDLLFDPATIWAMAAEGAIFGSLFGATVVQNPRFRIALAFAGTTLWILLALAANRQHPGT
jgi:membrane-bound metal-dependent hydrolase YbcI (DUF457 family)